MGTRNLTCVYIDGEYKVAQYCQWDGYPEGQGSAILAFLNTVNHETFKSKVRKLTEATEEEIKALWVECGADPDSNMVSMDISDKMKERYPQFQRDCGAEILPLIYLDKVNKVQKDLEFAQNGLFCEWCYVIDFDKNTFEVYTGFHEGESDPSWRFHGEGYKEYAPVKLEKSWELNNLPTEEEFIDCLKEKD